MSASPPAGAKWLPVLSGLLAVIGFACGSSEPSQGDAAPGNTPTPVPHELVISGLICQLDAPTLTATALGSIRSTLEFDLPGVIPVVSWLGADGMGIVVQQGGPMTVGAGKTVLFSVPALMQDGMSACRIEVSGAPLIPITGVVEANARLTSELAR